MPTDTRVRITQKMIKEGFMELLKTNPLSKITVTQICRNAEINRVTFYKYYTDVYDLYEKIIDEFIEEESVSINEISAKKNLKEAIEAVLEDVYERSEQYVMLFNGNIDDYHKSRNYEKCISKIATLEFSDYKVAEEQQEWLRTFLCCGGGGVLAAWINGGMKQPPKEIANLIYLYITQLLKLYNKV